MCKVTHRGTPQRGFPVPKLTTSSGNIDIILTARIRRWRGRTALHSVRRIYSCHRKLFRKEKNSAINSGKTMRFSSCQMRIAKSFSTQKCRLSKIWLVRSSVVCAIVTSHRVSRSDRRSMTALAVPVNLSSFALSVTDLVSLLARICKGVLSSQLTKLPVLKRMLLTSQTHRQLATTQFLITCNFNCFIRNGLHARSSFFYKAWWSAAWAIG